MKKVYYARPISVDGTPQELRDMATIWALGYEPWPVGEEKAKAIAAYKAGAGMEVFRPYVCKSDAVFFRAFPDGSIGAGVALELKWAEAAGLPVMEFPRQVRRRALSVEDTRAMLEELGQR